MRPQSVAANRAAPQQINSGWISMATMASLTSRASTFLPRYSGVRPTISPARNTATMTYISMFRNPAPIPLKSTLSIIRAIGTTPPSGWKLSCIELTDPFEVAVVIAAQVAEATGPCRTSLPSRLPDWRTGRPASRRSAGARLRSRPPPRPAEGAASPRKTTDGMRAILDHLSEHDDRRHRDDDDRDHFEEVAPRDSDSRMGGTRSGRRSRHRWCQAA